MNIFQLIVGAVLVYTGFYGGDRFSPVLFVEGMILVNLVLLGWVGNMGSRHNR